VFRNLCLNLNEAVCEIRIKGKTIYASLVTVGTTPVISLGKWVKIASIHDEEWTEGQLVQDPPAFIDELRQKKFPADIFTFTQKIPECAPKYRYKFEMDNVAVVRTNNYEEWWEKRLPQETRKNVRRAGRRGVTVREAQLDDNLVRGITAIYNETPFRQGVPFGHYGKNFETVKKEVSTLMDRSEFIGAYFQDELIGFIKLVYMGPVASILHIVSLNSHYDKRPTNVLLAKAVELCCARRKSFLVYGRFNYGNKQNSTLTEFKTRHGFEKMEFPKYYVPMTLKGRLFLITGLHRGLIGVLPSGMINLLIRCRAAFYRLKTSAQKPSDRTPTEQHETKLETCEKS
jgi:hypothetical protein